jgi:hypothetical protein
VGIFVALKKINELIEELTEPERSNSEKIQEKLKNWEIIYENAEDFDIRELNEDESIKSVDSRHQVKANKNGKNLNDYKKVLSCIIDGVSNDSCFNTKDVSDDKRFLHTIVDVQGKNGDGTIMNETEFNEAKTSGVIRNNPTWIDNPQKVRFNEYEESKFYCELATENDNLKNWTIEQIKKVIPDVTKSDSAYEGLLWELDQEIRKEHSAGNNPILSFVRILEVITSDNSIENFEEARLRESFINTYIEYKEDLIEEEVDFSENEKNTDKIIKKLYNSQKDNFYQFLINIQPDAYFIKNKNFQEDGFREVFIESLLKIQKFDLTGRSFYCSENIKHIPTTFSSSKKARLLRIVENENLVKEYFEGSFLINKEFNGKIDENIMNLKSITDYKNKEEETKTNWQESMVNDKELFLRPDKIEMISVKNAIKKLNK